MRGPNPERGPKVSDKKSESHSNSENGKDESNAEVARVGRNAREAGRRIGLLLRVLGPTAARIAYDVLTDNESGGE